jgi:exonuclease III
MPPRQQRPSVGGRPLRLATHNILGINSLGRIPALVRVWLALQLDVVVLQEVRCHWFQLAALQRRINEEVRRQNLNHGGFHAYWGPNRSTNGDRSAGVGILIRQTPPCGPITVQVPVTAPDGQGRFLPASLQWGGHRFTLACVYLPNDSGQQQQFLKAHIQPLAQQPQPILIGGDWNFVQSTPLDRVVRPQQQQQPPPQQQQQQQQQQGQGQHRQQQQGQRQLQPPLPARLLQQLAPDLQDAFRARHPQTRSFTFHSSRHASRIDRWHLSSSLVPYVAACFVGTETPSDHRPVVMDLLPRIQGDQGPGLRRVRLQHFWGDTAAKGEFEQFLAHATAAAPALGEDGEGARDWLAWWVEFKGSILTKAGELSRRVRQQRQLATVAARAPSAAALSQAYQALEAEHLTAAEAAAAMDNILAARSNWCAAVREEQAAAEWQRRVDWVHQGERPGPGLTAAIQGMQPPAAARHIVALRSTATGRLVTGGRPMAQLVNTHWAQMCSTPPANHAAQQEVLQALQAAGLHLPAAEADALGSATVTEEEVRKALKHSAPGKAPGMDGLPIDLYRKCADVFVPLLATLYTAIGAAGEVPLGFLAGVVVTLHKSGERSHPNNYRPITLLNGDYRVLAKILSHRFKAVQGRLVEPEQTGFLPGRLIGENLILNQLLPLAVGPSSRAVAVHLDFYKAYDTVIRDFLYSIMTVMGLGGGFLTWVKLLLTNTAAAALVNGYLSPQAQYTAGVRQGCPLSPQLYLLVAQAMLSYLKAKGFGVGACGRTFTACQYADDAQVFLASLASLRPFLDAMDVFKGASGQGINMDKTLVLPIGRQARVELWQQHFAAQHLALSPAQRQAFVASSTQQQMLRDPGSVPPGSRQEGLQVVASCKALGMQFQANGTVVVDWQARLDAVLSKFAFISRLPLSLFGRAFASSGYGISKLLYAAEFGGLPPAGLLDRLQAATAKLVDRKMAPAATGRRFAGVACPLLVGHPSTGGFGAFPWQQHVAARHALWAVRLMRGSPNTPWIQVARSFLCPRETACPAWPTLGVAMCLDGQHGPTGGHLPPVLQRMVQGLQALPAIQDVSRLPLTLGPWCAHAPLWCNPFLLQQGHGSPLPSHGLERDFADLAELSTLTTVQHAMTALRELQQATSYQQYREGVWAFWLQRSPGFLDRQHALDRLEALVAAVPVMWRHAANPVLLFPGQLQIEGPSQVVQRLLSRLGWSVDGTTVGLTQLVVRQATYLQLAPILEARAAKHQVYLAMAGQGLLAASAPTRGELQKVFTRLWSLKWDNSRKELFWRLTVDGVANAARMHMFGEPCACGGAVGPGRAHLYWDCPVAQSVLAEVTRGLQAQMPGCPSVQRVHVWLARPPSPSLHRQLWLVISQATLLGMDRGQRVLTGLRLAADAPGGRHLPLPLRVVIASRVAVATFWDMLADFTGLTSSSQRWIPHVPAHHPFFVVRTTAGGVRSLHVRRS